MRHKKSAAARRFELAGQVESDECVFECFQRGDTDDGRCRLRSNLHCFTGRRVAPHARLSGRFFHAADLYTGIGDGEFTRATTLHVGLDQIAEVRKDSGDIFLGEFVCLQKLQQ